MLDEMAVEILTPFAHGQKVLELGCGTGAILSQIAEIAEKAVGVDFSEGMLVHARARGLDVRSAELGALPFGDASFDLSYSFRVLPHVPNAAGAIAEAARVTRPGGHIVVELYNPWSLRYLAKRLAGPGRIVESRSEASVFTRWDSPADVRFMLPDSVELIDSYGIRVLTPFAAAHRVPILGPALQRAERSLSHSLLRRLSGFYVVVLRKT
jgi:SAM-dependent methyltransferase